MPLALDTYTACPDCDLLLTAAKPPPGHTAFCPRCDGILTKSIDQSVSKTLALSATGLLLYGPAITQPLLTFESLGFRDSANILESVLNFYQNAYYLVALLVFLSAVVFPLVLLLSIFLISYSLSRQRYPSFLAPLFRLHLHLEEWAMVEVYLLGILITVIKMADQTDIHYHAGILCFAALVLTTLAISVVVDRDLFWRLIEKKGEDPPAVLYWLPAKTIRNAADCGVIRCHTCHKLTPENRAGLPCPRCRSTLHLRKPVSVPRTWALVLTSAILLLPANLLPIMEVDFLGVPGRSTILDGISHFLQHGSIVIGLIILAASVLVPVFKIVGLVILLLATRPHFARHLREKTAMFRFIAFIGRWSMLDIFVIALLTVLVDFGFFTSIHTAPGATYFALVVLATMSAAITFDPRLIWDTRQRRKSCAFDLAPPPREQP